MFYKKHWNLERRPFWRLIFDSFRPLTQCPLYLHSLCIKTCYMIKVYECAPGMDIHELWGVLTQVIAYSSLNDIDQCNPIVIASPFAEKRASLIKTPHTSYKHWIGEAMQYIVWATWIIPLQEPCPFPTSPWPWVDSPGHQQTSLSLSLQILMIRGSGYDTLESGVL